MSSTLPRPENEDIATGYDESLEDVMAAGEQLIALVDAGHSGTAYAFAEETFDSPILAFLAMILAGFMAV